MTTSYTDLVNVPSFGKKRESTFSAERGNIAYFCRDCRKEVQAIELPPQKVGKKMKTFLYECPVCQWHRVSIGTTEWLKEHYERKH